MSREGSPLAPVGQSLLGVRASAHERPQRRPRDAESSRDRLEGDPGGAQWGVAFELEFEDTFDGESLDRDRWLPYYLPHWSSRARTAARYDLTRGALRLRIDADQDPWCPELDGAVRVSSLQTGAFAGAVGTPVGQHRFNAHAVVREAQPDSRLYTPLYGRIELLARFSDDPCTMGALWMIGYEDEPDRSAEICVCEIFGRDIGAESTVVGVGLHPFGDPRIVEDFSRPKVPIDARGLHTYASEWTPERVSFFVDDDCVKTSEQSPAYPMQLMLSLYDLPPGDSDGGVTTYPKHFVVEHVRGYRLVG
jgi:glycosyl hydrolase family 16